LHILQVVAHFAAYYCLKKTTKRVVETLHFQNWKFQLAASPLETSSIHARTMTFLEQLLREFSVGDRVLQICSENCFIFKKHFQVKAVESTLNTFPV